MIKSKILKVGAVLFFALMGNVFLIADNASGGVQSCQTCHINQDMVNDASITNSATHDASYPSHKAELVSFVSNNTTNSASEVSIDLAKLENYISKLK